MTNASAQTSVLSGAQRSVCGGPAAFACRVSSWRSAKAITSETRIAPTPRPATAMLSEATASAVGSISRSAAQIAAIAMAAR